MKKIGVFIAIGICIVFLTLSLILYFSQFRGELSQVSQNWGDFGSYFSGIMMPVLTGVNIWVFVRLTSVINEKNETEQQKRHQREIDHRKRLLITQLQQDELNRLSFKLDFLFMGNTETEVLTNTTICLSAIDNFSNQKQSLFPPKYNENAFKSLIELNGLINEALVVLHSRERVTNTLHILKLKHKAINELQEYTINNIDNKEAVIQ